MRTVAFEDLPKSMMATVPLSDATLVSAFTVPVPHVTEVHISESLNATASSPASAADPCAETFVVASVVHSFKPVTRTYGCPASQPITSLFDPRARHTSLSDEPASAETVT